MIATPRPRLAPAVWKAAAAVLAAAVADALPEGEAEREAELDAAAEADEEAEAEALEFAAPQSGLMFTSTPAPLQRVWAKVMVASMRVNYLKSLGL